MASEKRRRVCVTGSAGFLGSWIVKLLLSNDYIVHATVRDIRRNDNKYSHLMKLDKASENLKLFQADLLDYSSLYSAIKDCNGVFHIASPVPMTTVPNPLVQVIEPAVKGTLNVMKACVDAKVARAVVVSSAAAITLNPNWPKGLLRDETCWSDQVYCKATKRWYALSKTEAEGEAINYAKINGLDLVTLCPTLILGPILQSSVNASTLLLINLLKQGYQTIESQLRMIVDVRDVAQALLLVYQNPEAQGRYICTAHHTKTRNLVEKLQTMYPNYNYPKSFTEEEERELLTSEKLQRLGWSFRPLEETLADSVESYHNAKMLD